MTHGTVTGVYLGETDRLPRRFQHYRTPGTDERLAMYRLNRTMAEVLADDGQVGVEVVTSAHATAGGGSPLPLDLGRKAAGCWSSGPLKSRSADRVVRC